ncbi:MAG TPA: hypothetical protein PKD88_02380 [Nitrosomonas sp.]|nr:hypothetical protein [Nitrosomonas sp.]HMW19838.1 hypothetical protein [Nitrosomonas sp.]HMW69423.1 hypothetical protein [Nitrosomonas sp.]HMY60647.1 hypothetical protein [Nitrosomonas sp.]HMY89785.1 hypothetical protein [Nitrosomonas sp.]
MSLIVVGNALGVKEGRGAYDKTIVFFVCFGRNGKAFTKIGPDTSSYIASHYPCA